MTIYIYYATLSGHNFELASWLADHFAAKTVLMAADEVTFPVSWPAGDWLIVCPATDGSGEIAAPGMKLYRQLVQTPLTDCFYWVVGIGDQGFGTDFASAVTLFDHRLARQGAKPLLAPLKLDYELTAANLTILNAQLAKLEEKNA